MRNVKGTFAHSINLPRLPIYNVFNAGSSPHPWNPRPSLQLWVMAVAISASVFQGGAESLREPLSSYSCHLNPSLGFRCASLGLALADLLFTVSQAPGGMIPSAPVEHPSLGQPLPWATTSVVNPPSLPLFGEGVFKFSENLTVSSLALCFLATGRK